MLCFLLSLLLLFKIRTTKKDFVPMLCMYAGLWKDTREIQFLPLESHERLEDRDGQEPSMLCLNALCAVCPLQIQCKNETC